MVAWMVFGFGVSSSNMIHFVYILLVLSATAFRSGKRGMPPALGFVLLVFAQIVVLAQMAYGFDSILNRVGDNPTTQIYVNWIGFEDGKLSYVLRAHLSIVIILTLHRMSYWWILSHPSQPAHPIAGLDGGMQDGSGTMRQPTEMRTQSTAEHVAAVLPGSYTPIFADGKRKVAPAPTDIGPRITAYLVNFYSVYGYEVLSLPFNSLSSQEC